MRRRFAWVGGRLVSIEPEQPISPLPFPPEPTELRTMLRVIEDAVNRCGLPSVIRGRVSDSPFVD